MDNQHFWTAKPAFFCYIALFGGILLGGLILAIILLGLGINILEISFPSAIISLPVNEVIILTITLLFAKQSGASLKKLGLKKPNLKTLIAMSVVALFLLLLATGLSVIEETILGPDPDAEFLLSAVLPQNTLQLVALIGISLTLVGPAEELAFRGFIQRGFETSFGKQAGLVIVSIMFGLLHGLNSLRSIVPVTIVSLFLGFVWQKTDGNTTAVAWAHGLYDAIAILITYFAYF